MQRRHRGEDPSLFDQGLHVAEEQGQQQGADVGAVDVGIGHDDDSSVAGGLDVEAAAGAGTDDLDQGGTLHIGQHVGQGRLLDVEDLAADREQRLMIGVAGSLRRTHRRVALDDEQLRVLHTVVTAVVELRRQRGRLERGLAALILLVRACRDARLELGDDLLHEHGRLLLLGPLRRRQDVAELRFDGLGHDLADRGSAEDLLGLALELRFGQLHGDHRGQTGEDIVLLEFVLAEFELARIRLDGLAHRLEAGLFEPGEVSAAVRGGDDVDEGLDLRVIAGPPAQGDVDADLAFDLLGDQVSGRVEHRHRLLEAARVLQSPGVGDRRIDREVVDEFGDAAVKLEDLFAFGDDFARLVAGDAAAIDDAQLESGNEERRLSGAFDEVRVVELGLGEEDLRIGPILDPGSRRSAFRLADDVEAGRLLEFLEGVIRSGLARGVVESAGHTSAEGHLVHLRTANDLDVEARGQGIDDGGADTVQAAGGRIGGAAELAAGVELGHHDLDAGQPGLRLDVDGDAAALVGHRDRAVGGELDEDLFAVTTQGLVDGVVDDLPQTVHESAGVRRSDVHSRALAHRLESGQNGQMPGAVAFVFHRFPLVRLNPNRWRPGSRIPRCRVDIRSPRNCAFRPLLLKQ